MDGTLNDFFNEIDQIAPPKEQKNESVWQECYDNTSGYAYYWNTKTDEVTWEMPKDYKTWKEQNKTSNKPSNVFAPPKTTPLFPGAGLASTKIYKIQEEVSRNLVSDNGKLVGQPNKQGVSLPSNKCIGKSGAKEKSLLTVSYGEDSDSENEDKTTAASQELMVEGPQLPNDVVVHPNSNSDSKSDSEDDTDLLTKIQNRAKVLKDLGGELPPDVKKLVEVKDTEEKHNKKEKKNVTGFSLLSGYGDSEEEEENSDTKLLKSQPSGKTESHSTLFPIPKPIDITQFNESEPSTETAVKVQNSKAFQRKRRIGIDFVPRPANTAINTSQKVEVAQTDRQGLGFKSDQDSNQVQETSKSEVKTDYLGFKSGGVMFVKPTSTSPTAVPDQKEENMQENTEISKTEIMKKIEHIHKTLNEKLTFLSEGREPASPVQVMIIQMATLYEAVKAGGLTTSYLYEWLKETCAELVKLEKEGAPSGWLLQWDRLNKRYYYRNQQTGESQWEYPQNDIVGGDEAMDISTTPPPPVIDEEISQETPHVNCDPPLEPPPPPRIKSPSPPPPPTISKYTEKKKKVKSHTAQPPTELEIHLPSEKLYTPGEPLPPGVDSCEIPSYKPSTSSQSTENQLNSNDSMGLVLDSFYSDIASLDNSNANVASTPSEKIEITSEPPVKKKKKTKVKLAQGLSMKKKGVSVLVERWKSVQKDY